MSDEFRAYFSEDEAEVYVLTGPLPRLELKETPEPGDAPVYMDMESGEGYYPEEVKPEQAASAAEYAREQASSNVPIHLMQDTEAWRNEFSEIFGVDEYFSFWSIDQDKNGYDSSLNF